MCAKKIGEPRGYVFFALRRIIEPQVGRCVVGLLHRSIIGREFFERGGEPLGVTRQKRARCICQKFTLTRNSKLYKHGCDRRQNREDNPYKHKNGLSVDLAIASANPPPPT